MGWGCGVLVASATPPPRIPTQQLQRSRQPPPSHAASASFSSSSSASPAPAAARVPPSAPPSPASFPLLRCVPNSRSAQGALQFRRVAAEYVFPDPIPEFADAETDKFSSHMMERLSKEDIFGSSVEEIVGICAEILSEFLHTEYGGPGTLVVMPFIDMGDAITESELPGGPQAARAAFLWARRHVDKDWKEWTDSDNS